jgi:hypothetical protein
MVMSNEREAQPERQRETEQRDRLRDRPHSTPPPRRSNLTRNQEVRNNPRILVVFQF